MNKDLEAQLNEMGGDYRAIAYRLCGARRAEEERSVTPRVCRSRSSYWIAASALGVLCLGVGLGVWGRKSCDARPTPSSGCPTAYTLAFHRNADAVHELIRTQRADGSWENDFLTRQNAAALRHCNSIEARIAYKKAMRNLRYKGVL